jgi:hypothetical protein
MGFCLTLRVKSPISSQEEPAHGRQNYRDVLSVRRSVESHTSFGVAGLGVVLIQVLRIFFDLGSDRLFSSFFIKLGLPQLAVAVIAPLWYMPGIQFLWQLDYRYGNMLAFGLICIGALFWQLAKKKSQTMRDVNQRVQEESPVVLRCGQICFTIHEQLSC